LNLVFLKYATAGEILKLIQPFLGEGAAAATYDPANLLILQDNNRNMKRTMDLLALFRQRFLRQPAGAPVRRQQRPAHGSGEATGVRFSKPSRFPTRPAR
jgi:hypothetical protein